MAKGAKNTTKTQMDDLIEKVNRLEEIKAEKSELAKEEKEIMSYLEGYLDEKDADSIAVGDKTVVKQVSGYSFCATLKGITISKAKDALIQKLLETNNSHLMGISLKPAILFDLQQKDDVNIIPFMKKLGLEVTENHSVKIK